MHVTFYIISFIPHKRTGCKIDIYFLHQAKKLSLPDAMALKIKAINEHPSYHGVMTNEEAEAILKKEDSNCYLLRYSRATKSYMLSVMISQDSNPVELIHLVVNIKKKIEQPSKSKYELKGTDKRYEHISDLLDHYMNSSNSENEGTGKICEASGESDIPWKFTKYNFKCITKVSGKRLYYNK